MILFVSILSFLQIKVLKLNCGDFIDFLMLKLVKRAYDKKGKSLSSRLKINCNLLPNFKSCAKNILRLFKNFSTIADALPYLLQLIEIWNKLNVLPVGLVDRLHLRNRLRNRLKNLTGF
jgi:hypothetical protein